MKKTIHPTSRKPEKAAWAKKGIQAKIRDWSATLCLIGSSYKHTSVSTIKLIQRHSIWSTFDLVAKWWDARRYKGNSRVGTQWDCSHSCFSFFYTNCIIAILRRRSLTRTSASCTKRLLRANFKNQYNSFSEEISTCFSFSVLFCKNVQCSFLIYAFDINCCSWIFTCKTKYDYL